MKLMPLPLLAVATFAMITPIYTTCLESKYANETYYQLLSTQNKKCLDEGDKLTLHILTTSKFITQQKYKEFVNGENINSVNEKGFTPLMVAAEAGKNDKVNILLKRNARWNVKNCDDETSIEIARRKLTELEASSDMKYLKTQPRQMNNFTDKEHSYLAIIKQLEQKERQSRLQNSSPRADGCFRLLLHKLKLALSISTAANS